VSEASDADPLMMASVIAHAFLLVMQFKHLLTLEQLVFTQAARLLHSHAQCQDASAGNLLASAVCQRRDDNCYVQHESCL